MADVNRQQALTQQLKIALQPWHEALSDPPMAQQKVLKGLLAIYAQTTYGIEHRASRIETIAD